jgi:hypothetical protein
MSSNWRIEMPAVEAERLAEEYGKDRLNVDLAAAIADIRRAAELGRREVWSPARSHECCQALSEQGYTVFQFPPATPESFEMRWRICWGRLW